CPGSTQAQEVISTGLPGPGTRWNAWHCEPPGQTPPHVGYPESRHDATSSGWQAQNSEIVWSNSPEQTSVGGHVPPQTGSMGVPTRWQGGWVVVVVLATVVVVAISSVRAGTQNSRSWLIWWLCWPNWFRRKTARLLPPVPCTR